jgi:hypothetical protein
VKTQQLTQLLQIIQFGSAEIDPFYAVPFRFEGNPIAAAEAILKPPVKSEQPESELRIGPPDGLAQPGLWFADQHGAAGRPPPGG